MALANVAKKLCVESGLTDSLEAPADSYPWKKTLDSNLLELAKSSGEL